MRRRRSGQALLHLPRHIGDLLPAHVFKGQCMVCYKMNTADFCQIFGREKRQKQNQILAPHFLGCSPGGQGPIPCSGGVPESSPKPSVQLRVIWLRRVSRSATGQTTSPGEQSREVPLPYSAQQPGLTLQLQFSRLYQTRATPVSEEGRKCVL